MKERLRTLLYNAVSLYVDETIGQYDDVEEWKAMFENEMDCTIAELKELGVNIMV